MFKYRGKGKNIRNKKNDIRFHQEAKAIVQVIGFTPIICPIQISIKLDDSTCANQAMCLMSDVRETIINM